MNEQVADAFKAWLSQRRQGTISDAAMDTLKLIREMRAKALMAVAWCACGLCRGYPQPGVKCLCPCHSKEPRMATAEDRIKAAVEFIESIPRENRSGHIKHLLKLLQPSVEVALFAETCNPHTGSKGVALQKYLQVPTEGGELPDVLIVGGCPHVRFTPPQLHASPSYLAKSFKTVG